VESSVCLRRRESHAAACFLIPALRFSQTSGGVLISSGRWKEDDMETVRMIGVALLAAVSGAILYEHYRRSA
jgi:hypothetical protein